ncbi:DUF7501 family protein [Halobiforma nitratireducens]
MTRARTGAETGTDAAPVEDAVLAMKQTNPELSPAELASRVDCSIDRVETILEQRGRLEVDPDDSLEAADREWDDPRRCPFCGDPIADGGPGFVDHVDETDECAVAFSRWREGIAGDVAEEWVA